MRCPLIRSFCLTAAIAMAPLPLPAQDTAPLSGMTQVSPHMGEMGMPSDLSASESGPRVDDALQFEPFQQVEEMFLRDDVVWLMRHGPTDWSNLDRKEVAPTDCANQRVMIEEGIAQMRDLGTLLAQNEVLPARIVVSEWCRNQQTVRALLKGIARIDPDLAAAMPVRTEPGLNLLLSLQGSTDVTPLEALISSWDGDPGRSGPLLIISHYTNIEELTQFRVFEGETLVLDPDRDNLVLGYVRLRSAAPDVGHFADALASPLLDRDMALDMVDRYYEAINTSDDGGMMEMLAEDWVGYGLAGGTTEIDAEGLRSVLDEYRSGMSNIRFDVDDVHVSDDVVTVIGRVSGTHTGEILGQIATGRDISFKAIAVHRVEDGRIVESWQSSDRLDLLKQLKN